MAYTEQFDFTTGLTLYGKAKPLDTSPWSDGVIALTENGTTGEYSASTFLDGIAYSVYIQAGGSPASTDTRVGTITPPTDVDALQAQLDDIPDNTVAAIKADADLGTGVNGAVTRVSPASIMAAVGLESANLDTQMAAITAKTNLIGTIRSLIRW